MVDDPQPSWRAQSADHRTRQDIGGVDRPNQRRGESDQLRSQPLVDIAVRRQHVGVIGRHTWKTLQRRL